MPKHFRSPGGVGMGNPTGHNAGMFKRQALLTALVGMAFFSIVTPSQMPAASAVERGKYYELHLRSNQGKQCAIFDDKSLKVQLSESVILLSHAPDWQVCLLNTAGKCKYKTSEQNFRNKYFWLTTEPVPVLKPPVRRKHGLLFGLNATEMSCSAHDEVRPNFDDVYYRTKTPSKDRTKVCIEYRYTVCDCNCPIQVCHILQDLYRLPVDPHLPLAFRSRFQGDQALMTRVKTESLALRKGQIDASEPPGYKLLNDPQFVLLPNIKSQLLELIPDDAQKRKQ
jgi:hypothetical protein